MNEKKTITEPIIFQTSNGALELRTDNQIETIWANLDQISQLFNRDKSVVSRHIKNIFTEEELEREVVVAFFAITTRHGAIDGKTQTKNVVFYNLDLILSVGYRVNSKVATKFRQWATQTLKQHITKGFTINDSQIQKNKELFLKTIKDLKILSENTSLEDSKDLLSLIESFSNTWFSLDKYDKGIFPSVGSKLELVVSFSELTNDIQLLKQELISKNEATELFAQEKEHGNLQGILGNVYQTIFGYDAYETI
jgi:hypothetical protein